MSKVWFRKLNDLFVQLLYIQGAKPKLGWAENVRKMFSKSERRLAIVLSVFSCILLIAYCFFHFILQQTPGRMHKPSVPLMQEFPLWAFITSLPLPIPNDSNLVAVCVIAFVLVVFVFYGLAVLLTWNRRATPLILGTVVSAAILFFLVSVLSLPNVSGNIYNYILRGRIAAVHNSNPYYVAADKFPEDSLYPYASHRNTKRAGGKLPAWMIINVTLAKIAGDNVITNLLIYRLAFFLFTVANLALIAAILRRLNPRFLLVGVVLYSWNPIVVINGLNKVDTVMVFYLLLGIFLLLANRRRLAVATLFLSVFTKLVTLPLVTLYWLREIVMKRWRELLISSFILALTAVVIYALFWNAPDIILTHMSLLSAGGTSGSGLIKSLFRLIFVLLILWVAFTQDGSMERMLRGWVILMLYFSLFINEIASADYLMTLVAVVCLSLDWRIALLTILISFSSSMFQRYYQMASDTFDLPDLFQLPRYFVYLAVPGFTLLGIALVVVWRRIKQRVYRKQYDLPSQKQAYPRTHTWFGANNDLEYKPRN